MQITEKGRKHTKRKTALAIAGSDCSGGAGIWAGIKTMLANGVYALFRSFVKQRLKRKGIQKVE